MIEFKAGQKSEVGWGFHQNGRAAPQDVSCALHSGNSPLAPVGKMYMLKECFSGRMMFLIIIQDPGDLGLKAIRLSS